MPVPASVVLKSPDQFKLIGTPAKRLDTSSKVNGTARYGIDVRPAGVKIATLAQSPVAGGRVKSLDDGAAKAVKGVRQIVRLDDAVAVVADHMGAAKKGLAALKIEWDDGQNAKLVTSDIAKELEQATLGVGAVAQNIGNVDKAMATAATKVEAIYQVPFLAHATMEPMNCTVHFREGECEIWVGTQVMTRIQSVAAQTAGLPVEKVIVHNHLIGGGFGRRLEADGAVRAVEIAKQVDGPVKVVWTREEDIQHDMYRPYWFDRISAGLDEQGKPVAWKNHYAGSSVIARWAPPYFKDGLDGDSHGGCDQSGLRLSEFSRRIFARGAQRHYDRVLAQRRPIAQCLRGRELCRRNGGCREAGSSRLSARAARQIAASESGARSSGGEGRLGAALPRGVGRGVSLQFVFGSYLAQVAEVEVSKDGSVRVRRVVCAMDCGVAVNPDTVQAQLMSGITFGATAALYGEITLKNGRVEQTNFDTYQMIRMNEAPAIEVHIVKSSESPGGMGETGTSGVVPAIANAIFAATGKRLRKMPIDVNALKHQREILMDTYSAKSSRRLALT